MRIAIVIVCFLKLAFWMSAQTLVESTDSAIFSKQSFQNHLRFLSNDLFEGRGTGTRGGELAAKYIANELNDLGIVPFGSDGSLYQYVPMHSTAIVEPSDLKIFTKQSFHELRLNRDYIVYQTGEQTYLPNKVELVFAGYGILAPEFDYNDYLNIDVKDKIVVVLDGEPLSDDANFFNGKSASLYSNLRSKQIIASSRGAVGLVVIPNPLSDTYSPWGRLSTSFLREQISLAYSVSSNLTLQLSDSLANVLFDGSGTTYYEIIQDAKHNKLHSFSLPTSLSFRGTYRRRDFLAPNIVGALEGSDRIKKNEYILVSAHYDHLGIGSAVENDSIYNGALDNAMGVAALIEIAKALKNTKSKINRSILFVLTTGEEHGQLGATYYTDNPLVPLHQTIANINIDGIAFIDNFNSVVLVGAEYSNLGEKLEIAMRPFGVYLSKIPDGFVDDGAFTFSDQLAFAKAGIPSMLVLDGPDYVNIPQSEGLQKLRNYSEFLYHSPKDDLAIDINYNAALKHTKLLFEFLLFLANSEDSPKWNNNSPFLNEYLRIKAEKR